MQNILSSGQYRYFTTPIFYASGNPHAGHFLSLLVANVMSNHYFHRGMQTCVLTGMDEHGEKIEAKAQSFGLQPQAYVDSLEPQWRHGMELLNLKYDIFMRTTSKQHQDNVKDILRQCYAKGDIYFGQHEGAYCLQCEEFLTSAQMDSEHSCLIHRMPTQLRSEGNYYFRFQKYKQRVIEAVAKGNICVQERYQHELLAILRDLEGDLSISRPRTRTNWGIELPFDKEHVTYVWFDALPNYLTGVGGVDAARSSPFWNGAVHVIGREILKFHGAFWPAMLLSLELPLPKLFVTGWMLADGHKMSKSAGKVLTADQLARYGRDAFANAVFRLAPAGEDFELGVKTIMERFNSDLANGIGNLLARTLGLIEKYFESVIPLFYKNCDTELEKSLVQMAQNLPAIVKQDFDDFQPNRAINHIWQLIAHCDKYISELKPWAIMKEPTQANLDRLANILAHCVAVLRYVGYMSAAFFPEKMEELLVAIGEPERSLNLSYQRVQDFYQIASGHKFLSIPKIYERMDILSEMSLLTATNVTANDKKNESNPATVSNDDTLVTLDQFSKSQLRVAKVIQADVVEGASKLLRLTVSLGALGVRQVFSGIRQWVQPEDILNRKVILVSNLVPRKMKWGESQGMVLATTQADSAIRPVYLEDCCTEGELLS